MSDGLLRKRNYSSARNGRRRKPQVVRCENQGQAWDMLYQNLETIRRIRSGICEQCRENVRLEGMLICFECLEEEILGEMEQGND